MTREDYCRTVDNERICMDNNVVFLRRSAEMFRPHDPQLAGMLDDLADRCGNIAAYIGERLL